MKIAIRLFLPNSVRSLEVASMSTCNILQLTIERFRGIRTLTWLPRSGANIILGGGDAGKTTILESIALLLAPTNAISLSDADYHGRKTIDGFKISAVMSLPAELMSTQSYNLSWPWEWNNNTLQVPSVDADDPIGCLPSGPMGPTRVI